MAERERQVNVPLPTQHEINPFDDLDGREAAAHFRGKSLDDAETMFRESPDYYVGDLLWMGPTAFRFYVEAAIRFIRSDAATGESYFVAAFASTLEQRLEQEAQAMAPVASQIEDVCREIVEQWSRFDVDLEIWGDVRKRYQVLHAAFLRLATDLGAQTQTAD